MLTLFQLRYAQMYLILAGTLRRKCHVYPSLTDEEPEARVYTLFPGSHY